MSNLEMVPSTAVDAVEYWEAFLKGRPEVTRRDPVLRAREFLELPTEERERYHAFMLAGKVVGTVRLGQWDLTEDPHAITFFSMAPEARDLDSEAIKLASRIILAEGAKDIVAGFSSGYLEAFKRGGFHETFSRMTMRANLKRLPGAPHGLLHPLEEDTVELATFLEQAYEGHLDQQHGMHLGTSDDWLAYMKALVSQCLPSCSWLARDPAGIEGVCLVSLGADGPFVNELAVRKDARGKGLGGTLTTASMESLVAAGHSHLTLVVTVGNDSAIHLYKNLGFREIGQRLVGAAWRP